MAALRRLIFFILWYLIFYWMFEKELSHFIDYVKLGFFPLILAIYVEWEYNNWKKINKDYENS